MCQILEKNIWFYNLKIIKTIVTIYIQINLYKISREFLKSQQQNYLPLKGFLWRIMTVSFPSYCDTTVKKWFMTFSYLHSYLQWQQKNLETQVTILMFRCLILLVSGFNRRRGGEFLSRVGHMEHLEMTQRSPPPPFFGLVQVVVSSKSYLNKFQRLSRYFCWHCITKDIKNLGF